MADPPAAAQRLCPLVSGLLAPSHASAAGLRLSLSWRVSGSCGQGSGWFAPGGREEGGAAGDASLRILSPGGDPRHPETLRIWLRPFESHFGEKNSIKMVEMKNVLLIKAAQIMWGPDQGARLATVWPQTVLLSRKLTTRPGGPVCTLFVSWVLNLACGF